LPEPPQPERRPKCSIPSCRKIGRFEEEVVHEPDGCKTFDVSLCRRHYIELCVYNGDNPEDEGLELAPREKAYVYSSLGLAA
jgi:hypothetical protein